MSLLTSKAVGKAVDLKKENERLNQGIADAAHKWAELTDRLEDETGLMPADRDATVDEIVQVVRMLKTQIAVNDLNAESWERQANDCAARERVTLQSRARLVLLARQNGKMRRILLSVRYKNCPDQKDRDDIDDVLRLK